MKVVICQINSKYVHSSLAAWCLKAGVEKYSETEITPLVLEGTVNISPDEMLKSILDEKPDLLGFCCYIWNILYVKALAARVKSALPHCVVVLGGPEVSYNAKEVLEEKGVADFVISGEGELPFARLCDSVNRGEHPEGFGICSVKDGKFLISEPYLSCEEPPSPYCEEYFAALGGRMAYFETSRGCPYSCAFCLSGRCGGVRYFDMERVKRELVLLANSGTQTVKFVDRTFNANKKRAKEIVRFIIEHFGKDVHHRVCFHFEIAGDILDEELITLLTTAPKGLFQLEIGMQSFNEATLAAINRKTDCRLLKDNILRLTNARNMHIHVDLIAGLPLEGLESFKESFNTAYSLKADMLQLGFLKLLHGADMREDTEKFPCIFSENPPYEVVSTPYISAEELSLLRDVEEVLERTYNSGRFVGTLNYIEGLGYAPFDMFEKLSKSIPKEKCESLNDFTKTLLDALCAFERVDKAVLRDKMVLDRLMTVGDGKLPDCLRVEDPFLKTAKHFLEKSPATKRRSGTKRAVALLYSEQSVVWCDYHDRDPVSGRFSLNSLSFDEIVKLCD